MIKIIANGAYAASFPLISFLASSSMESRTILTKQIYFYRTHYIRKQIVGQLFRLLDSNKTRQKSKGDI